MEITIRELKHRLDNFDIVQESASIIEDTAETIADFNRKQLFAGLRSTGTEIKPEYAPYTILIKDQKGQPTDRVTLKDTGEFYDSISVDVNSKSYELVASDDKTDDLQNIDGNRILGLTKENKGEYLNYTFIPELRDRITRKLGFAF